MPALEDLTLMHYRLRRRLAQGGMSEIYLAEDTQSHRLVAIKLVSNERQEFYERFQREVEAMAALHHDHIIPAFDYGSYGSWYYMVMPYIEYGTLRDKLAHGPLSLKEAGILLEQIADALQFAHDHGMLHRDIKPSNILLRDGIHVYLADFGLVKRLRDESAITQAGCLVGTPEYMAPELAEDMATPQSDIYALGIVLYQMLTGQVPFKSQTPMGVYWKHLREQPLAPSKINPTITRRVEQVVLRALDKDPKRRYPSARAFADAYHAALASAPPVARWHTLSREPTMEIKHLFSMSSLRSIGNTGRLLRSVSPGKVAATALTALFILCVLPAVLGFSLYRSQSRSNGPSVGLASNVLFKGKTPPFVLLVTPTLLPVTPVTTRVKTVNRPATHTTSYIVSSTSNQKYQNKNDPDHDGQKGGESDSHYKDHDHDDHDDRPDGSQPHRGR